MAIDGTSIVTVLVPNIRAKLDDDVGSNDAADYLYSSALLAPKIGLAVHEIQSRWDLSRTLLKVTAGTPPAEDTAVVCFPNEATHVSPELDPANLDDLRFVAMIGDIVKLFCHRIYPIHSSGTRDMTPSNMSKTAPKWRTISEDSKIIDEIVEKWKDYQDPPTFQTNFTATS